MIIIYVDFFLPFDFNFWFVIILHFTIYTYNFEARDALLELVELW